jgi:hypothetical protein
MDEDATTNQTKWCLVEVERPLKKSHALILGLSMACQRRLRVSLACGRRRSQRYGEHTVDAGQYNKEVLLERANSTFSPVQAMHIWWDKLESSVPLEGDGFFVCCSGLEVKDLEVSQKTPGCQACHYER